MGYSGLGKLREALAPGTFTDTSGPPTVKTGTAADLSDAQLLDQIAEADSLIDSALGQRYVTPVAPLDPAADPLEYPHPIDYWSRSIAAYLATCVKRGSLDFSNDDPVYRRYALAKQQLDAVAAGTYRLQIPIPGEDVSYTGGVGDVLNPTCGNLFDPSDFNLTLDYRPLPAGRWYDDNIGQWYG